MKKIKLALVAFVLVAQSLNAAPVLMSLPVVKISKTETAVVPTESKPVLTEKKYSYKELKAISESTLNRKLNLKEKATLKLLKGKINKSVKKAEAKGADGKKQLIALLLVIFVGTIGIHRFYLGYTWQGVVQLLTLGGLGVWTLIDLIRIITGDLKPKDGEYAETL